MEWIVVRCGITIQACSLDSAGALMRGGFSRTGANYVAGLSASISQISLRLTSGNTERGHKKCLFVRCCD